jgi:hypothetical protein
MKQIWIRIALYGCFLLLLAACSQAVAPALSDELSTPQNITTTVTKPQTEPASSSSISTQNPPMPQSTQLPLPPGMESLIETAKEDLARRLSVSATEIDIAEAKAVTWPNASLGCPQPGMQYAEVLTSGFLIVLHANNQTYEYHAGKGLDVFYCENPSPPVPGMPGDV